jgi:hypothetical protein
VLHQLSANARILAVGGNSYRTKPDDFAAFVQEVTADDHAVVFGHNAVEAGVGEQHAGHSNAGFRNGKVGRKIMLVGDGAECLEDDLAAWLSVIRCSRA